MWLPLTARALVCLAGTLDKPSAAVWCNNDKGLHASCPGLTGGRDCADQAPGCCVQVLEEIPREHHCAIINELTAMAGRWIAVTMGSLVSTPAIMKIHEHPGLLTLPYPHRLNPPQTSVTLGSCGWRRARAEATTLPTGTGESAPVHHPART